MRPFYGIDLGTTNSVICTLDDAGMPYVYHIGRQDSFPVPSVVWYQKGQKPVVGHLAKNYLPAHPELCVQHIKREMGSESFKRVINGEEKTPLLVSADILRDLVEKANAVREESGEASVYDVVVSIPAKFGDTERRNTIEAVKKAGLHLIALVHEPTAAALSFGIKKEDNKTFIVYDLGGGTFDVNIMRVSGNKLKILAKGGDLQCGGIDWDKEIVKLALVGLATSGDLSAMSILQNQAAKFSEFISTDEGQAMLAKAEDIKISICDPNCHNDLDFIFTFGGKTHTVRIQRDKFFANTSGLVSKTIRVMEDTIREAGIGMDNLDAQVDEIIMVGGSSYMPQVEMAIKARFNVKNIHRQEPGLAIAKGAALYAGLKDISWANTLSETDAVDKPSASLKASPNREERATAQIPANTLQQRIVTGAQVNGRKEPTPTKASSYNLENKNRERVEIEEVGGRSYGIAFKNGKYFSVYNIILKSDDLVINKVFKDKFKTSQPNLRRISIDIRENDSIEEIVKEGNHLRNITPNALLCLPREVPKGTPVDITLSRDMNGIITISASCLGQTIDVELKK